MQQPHLEIEVYSIQKPLYHPTKRDPQTRKHPPLIIAQGPISIIERNQQLYWRIGDFGYLQKMREGNLTRPEPHLITAIPKEKLTKKTIQLMFYDALRIKSVEKIHDEDIQRGGLGPNKFTLDEICYNLKLN